jgi:hypothetical protein
MRKILFLICIFCFVCATSAYATKYDPCDHPWKSKIYNECHEVDTAHQHEQESDFKAGVGVDIRLWENDTEKLKRLEEIGVEYRADFNEEDDQSVYLVAQVDGTGAVDGLVDGVKSVFGKIFGLFKRNKVEE